MAGFATAILTISASISVGAIVLQTDLMAAAIGV
jgi:hypothetical protein